MVGLTIKGKARKGGLNRTPKSAEERVKMKRFLRDKGKTIDSDISTKDLKLQFKKAGGSAKPKKVIGFKKTGVISERELSLFKRRLNNDKIKHDDFMNDDWDPRPLSKEQDDKGRRWLMDKWKTPKGKERENNPFGGREENVLDNYSHTEFTQFTDISRSLGFKNYVPIYRVVGKDGSTFEYYVQGGKAHIIG